MQINYKFDYYLNDDIWFSISIVFSVCGCIEFQCLWLHCNCKMRAFLFGFTVCMGNHIILLSCYFSLILHVNLLVIIMLTCMFFFSLFLFPYLYIFFFIFDFYLLFFFLCSCINKIIILFIFPFIPLLIWVTFFTLVWGNKSRSLFYSLRSHD